MKLFRRFAVAGTILTYALATLGSWTRINGAGMACPDWPLCHGAIVPTLVGGVVLEWLHRAVALVVSLIVVAVIITALRVRSRVPAVVPLIVALAAIIVVQIALGGVTIFSSNSPVSVTMHWGTAMLLLATMTSLTVVAFAYADDGTAVSWARSASTWPLVATVVAAFATMCAGAYVSSSGAGLACPSVPACGTTVFGQNAPQVAQMTHRILAGVLFLFAVAAAAWTRGSSSRANATVRIGLGLLVLQITLGVLNVVWLLPRFLREAHAANAGATFLAFVVAAVLASLRTLRAAHLEQSSAA